VRLRCQISPKIAAPVSVKMPITGLVQAWDSGDNVTRLALLQNMFTGLIIRSGEIVNTNPGPRLQQNYATCLRATPGLLINVLWRVHWPR